jgi:hypothetical protein
MNSPTEQHLGAAFRDLVAEQPFIPDVPVIEHQARRARRRDLIVRGGIGAGAAAVAAAIGVASVVPSAPAGKPQASGVHPASAGAPASPAGPAGAQPLAKLAAYVASQSRPAGDATLVERKTGAPGQATINVWDLYADKGQYFFSRTEAGLPAQVNKGNNQGSDQGSDQFAREVAAATYAVTGNLHTAALKMASPYGTPVPAWLRAQVKDMKAGTQIDNYVWENSEDALIAGSGNPQVRAGVLRLISLLPGIKVTKGTVDGQPALTLTAGAAEVGNTAGKPDKAYPKGKPGAAYSEAISVNADTGVPLQIADGLGGKVTGIASYVVTRVNLADVAAGKF